MDLFLIASCIDDIMTKIVAIDNLVMESSEEDIDWDKVKCFAELIQEQAETLAEELYED